MHSAYVLWNRFVSHGNKLKRVTESIRSVKLPHYSCCRCLVYLLFSSLRSTSISDEQTSSQAYTYTIIIIIDMTIIVMIPLPRTCQRMYKF